MTEDNGTMIIENEQKWLSDNTLDNYHWSLFVYSNVECDEEKKGWIEI